SRISPGVNRYLRFDGGGAELEIETESRSGEGADLLVPHGLKALGFRAPRVNARRQSGETIPAFRVGLDRAFIIGGRSAGKDVGIGDRIAVGVGRDAFKIDMIQIVD